MRRRLGRVLSPDRPLDRLFAAAPVAYTDGDGDFRVVLPRHLTLPAVRAFVDVTPAGDGARVLVEVRPTDPARAVGAVAHLAAGAYGLVLLAGATTTPLGFGLLAVLAINLGRVRYAGWLLRRYVLPLVGDAVAP